MSSAWTTRRKPYSGAGIWNSTLDATALAALKNLVDDMAARRVSMILVGLTPGFAVKLRRAGIQRVRGRLTVCISMKQARARCWRAGARLPVSVTDKG